MRPCWGKIPTSNMALKWRYQTRCNGDKRHEDELNTETWLTPQNSKRPHLKLIIQTRDIRISCCGLWGRECLKNAFHKPLVCSLCTDPTPVRKREWRGGGGEAGLYTGYLKHPEAFHTSSFLEPTIFFILASGFSNRWRKQNGVGCCCIPRCRGLFLDNFTLKTQENSS